MSLVAKAKRQLQMSFVLIVKLQAKKSTASISGEMNVDLSYFSAGVQAPAERS
ncbi:hypothetical protein ABNX05_19120 [Lysinibacillus sp. M3]|uniref:Uncharacterized protein n=1 Tax=Lysinibacillus zambalensis TaxID=3160866 RepID=A0ABV1MW47_9BACI